MADEDQENEQTLSSEVDELLEQGLTQKEIEALGYSPSLIRQRIRKRIKAGKGLPQTSARDSSIILRRQTESILPEWVAAQLDLFDGSERDKRIFMSGLVTPLLGLRLFCEAMKPFTELLTVWQKGQAEAAAAAQGANLQIAHEAAAGVAEAIAPALDSLKQAIVSTSPNPLQSMMVDAMSPFVKGLFGQLLGAFVPGGQQSQGTPQTQGLPGFTRERKRKEDENG